MEVGSLDGQLVPLHRQLVYVFLLLPDLLLRAVPQSQHVHVALLHEVDLAGVLVVEADDPHDDFGVASHGLRNHDQGVVVRDVYLGYWQSGEGVRKR